VCFRGAAAAVVCVVRCSGGGKCCGASARVCVCVLLLGSCVAFTDHILHCVCLQHPTRLVAARSIGVAVAAYSLLFTLMLSKIAEPFLNCSTPSLLLPRSSSEYAELRCFDWENSTWNQLAASSMVCGTVFVIAWPAYMFCTIASHRDDRGNDGEVFQTRYGWMYIRYRPERW
jgi:hypothetical protein